MDLSSNESFPTYANNSPGGTNTFNSNHHTSPSAAGAEFNKHEQGYRKGENSSPETNFNNLAFKNHKIYGNQIHFAAHMYPSFEGSGDITSNSTPHNLDYLNGHYQQQQYPLNQYPPTSKDPSVPSSVSESPFPSQYSSSLAVDHLQASEKITMDTTFNSTSDFALHPPQTLEMVSNHMFDIANSSSFESIPDSSFENQKVFNKSEPISFSDMGQGLTNYSLNDLYTPVHSDISSFTPSSSFFEDSVKPSNSQQVSYCSPTPNTSHKISKKQSLRGLNTFNLKSKRSLIGNSNVPSSFTPISAVSPCFSISPPSSQYKGDDEEISPLIANPKLMKTVRLNQMGQKFENNLENRLESTLRRKTYPTPEMSSNSSYQQAVQENEIEHNMMVKPSSFAEPSSFADREPVMIASKYKNSSNVDLSQPKKYTRRRLLPRSKNGCWICRIKHLKCDEVRPTCSSCSKFKIACDYSPEKPDYVTNKVMRKEKLAGISNQIKQNQTNSSNEKLNKSRQSSNKSIEEECS